MMTEGKPDQWLFAPTMDMVEDAAEALKNVAVQTPLIENPEVNKLLGCRLLIKAETAQRTGAFKFRGAYNRIRHLNEAELTRGVIAFSSGNHSQAVACAAGLIGTSSQIVMPDDAPDNKKRRTRELGADIITFDRLSEDREDVTAKLIAKNNRVLVPPFEDARILAGAGTMARELIQQATVRKANIDIMLTPCGGGGLTASTALVFNSLSPETKLYAVEPELFDDTRRSLEAGKRLSNIKGPHSICDAIMTDQPGELTFSINQKLLSAVLTVTDDEACRAMKFAFDHFKIVVEPGASVGLAAILSQKIDITGQTVALVLSGGNVDAKSFSMALASGA